MNGHVQIFQKGKINEKRLIILDKCTRILCKNKILKLTNL